MPKFTRFIIRLILSVILIAGFFVLTQDFQIFPGLYSGLFSSKKPTAPIWAEPLQITAADGQSVPVWRVKADSAPKKKVAILFHGNAETLQSFSEVQYWLKSLGITSYSLEYRGYSGNSGWPSEQGFHSDSEAVFELLLKEENIQAKDVLILGSSIGTGPAAYVAQKYSVGTLVLLAAYTSLPDVVAEMPLYGPLSPFLWYNFPTKEYISRLTNTCVVLAHGKQDHTIPFHHSEQLKSLYHGTGGITLIVSEQASHNGLLGTVRKLLEKEIRTCLEKT